MDGIDISLVRTNGIKLKRLNENYFYKYNRETKNFLLNILNDDIEVTLKRKKRLDEIITYEHFKALDNLDIVKKSNLIGFHGQTIYHNPEINISLQLGNPKKLATLLNKDVVSDFRSLDIKLGGEGAPLAPIYHKFLLEKLDLKLPSCIINIGGVSNISYWDGTQLIGFDIGPGNALMDDYIRSISNKYFDENGNLASKGIPNKEMLDQFLTNIYFKKKYPKSLDRNFFKSSYLLLLNKNISISDTLATLAEFTVGPIIQSVNSLPKKIKNIIVTGGGYKNNHLMNCLKKRLDLNIIMENELDINFDYVESELIAFLSARSLYNLPYTFPSTTGNSNPSSGGLIYSHL